MVKPDVYDRVAQLDFDSTDRAKERVVKCNLCHSSDFWLATRRDRYGYAVDFNICPCCGLGFLSPRLTAEEYGRFYQDIYRPLVSAYHGRLIDAVTVQDEQRQYTANLLTFLEPVLSGKKIETLLDIGGSTGVVAEGVVKAFGCRGLVLDPSPDELEQAQAKGLETVCGLLEDYDETQAGVIDFALLCQTIDHLLDIMSSLKKIHSILADDGFFYVDIVDFTTIMRREGDVEEAVKIDHPYYLIRSTMEAYLAKTGFEIVANTVLPDGHHVGYLCQKAQPVGTINYAGVGEFVNEVRALVDGVSS